jgi:enoyl-CoA hydratase/carnithine racemase
MAKVRFEREGDVAVITLADPPLNLFSMELIGELDAAIAEAEAQASEVRALLVRAEGENFSAGAQVDDVFQGLSVEQAEERLVGFREMMRRSERLPFPTLAAVRGLCLAAGLETVLALDLIWASETAMFAFAEPVIGLTPPAGGVFRLAARAGAGRAVESVLTGRPYPAKTMEDWGVVNRVLADEDLDEKAMAFAEKLAQGPTRAYDVTKQMLLAYRNQGAAAAEEMTPRACAELFETADLAHGIESLLANGPGHARFEGR